MGSETRWEETDGNRRWTKVDRSLPSCDCYRCNRSLSAPLSAHILSLRPTVSSLFLTVSFLNLRSTVGT